MVSTSLSGIHEKQVVARQLSQDTVIVGGNTFQSTIIFSVENIVGSDVAVSVENQPNLGGGFTANLQMEVVADGEAQRTDVFTVSPDEIDERTFSFVSVNYVEATLWVVGTDDSITLTVGDPSAVPPNCGYLTVLPMQQPVNEPPVASFDGTVSGFVVSVDASASSDPDGTIASYAWDFGDGTTGSGIQASHTYDTEGTYTVTLRVTDDEGATDAISRTATVPDGAIGPPIEPPGGGGGQTSIFVLAGVAAVIALVIARSRQ